MSLVNRGGRGRKVVAKRSTTLFIGTDENDQDTTLTADRGVYFSADGRRRKEELMNVAHKKRRVNPTELDDSLAVWTPVALEEEQFITDASTAETDNSAATTIPGKRKTYESSRPFAETFLDEIMAHDALGDNDAPQFNCALCKCAYIAGAHGPDRVRLFKCNDCGEFLQCGRCCVGGHARTPLHVLHEWNGEFWIDATLQELGLVYQLGHGGMPCPYPDSRMLTMTVIHLPVVHRVKYRYCKCQRAADSTNVQQCLRNKWYPATITDPATCATFSTLETFRLQNVVGNMNVHDFITAIERQTKSTISSGMDWIPHRYKEFMRMSRQWAFLIRIKHAGLAHTAAGLAATAPKQAAVKCWACPHDKRNLPPDWRDVDPKFRLKCARFLYMLLVALDANFKLKNRIRANEHPDPSLGPGWGYFVQPEKYRTHIKNYVPEKDVSTCIAFAALLQKDTRGTTGLRVSGVGGCVCVRHECVLSNGIGDLQKGERFANMDFILLSALAGFALMWLTISYDISCQWKINLPTRNTKMPEDIRLPLDTIKVQCALPVWHASSHEESCRNANSLSFKPGVGKSEGEGIERTWSTLNPAAYHTKDMSLGNRVDTLEDKIDSHNFLKNLGLGNALRRKLAVARAERDRQVQAFKEVSQTIEKDLRTTWQNQIETWLKDPTEPNPYLVVNKDGPTEVQVRLQLKKDEEKEAANGKAPLHGTSATAFLTGGMQIEQAQRRILAEQAGLALIAPERETRVQELRIALLKKLAIFRKLQAVYMPGAARAMLVDEEARDADAPPPKAEHIKLYMPHELPAADRGRGCVSGLPEMESKLRAAQCAAALLVLRSRLHAKRHLISFRNEHLTGQIQTTKARTLIGQVGDRVTASAQKYRKGRGALLALKGAEFAPHFRELKDDNIRLDGDYGESDATARKKLSMISSGHGARAPRNAPGTSKRIMSWIWTVKEGSGDDWKDLHDSMRVEWTCAKARKTRWQEEVLLLEEEMRRTLRYLEWQAAWWEEQKEPRSGARYHVQAGLRAYALKQVSLHRRLAAHFKSQWETTTVVDTAAIMESADLAQFFTGE
ncbi:hypothetical protein B0H14DRAFT_2622840 [Mycena olivaceomarginata]|nr:hypothetical protein B0H14DRAFT_2622840 [Mycena olivaceomarginata]